MLWTKLWTVMNDIGKSNQMRRLNFPIENSVGQFWLYVAYTVYVINIWMQAFYL